MLGLLNVNKFLAAPLVAVLIMASMFSGVNASSTIAPSSAPSCDTERGRPAEKPAPAGQLMRRGVVGEIVGVDDETGVILLEMKFGIVEITVPEDFTLTDDMVGSRMAGLLNKEVEPVEDLESSADSSTGDGTTSDGTTGDGTTGDGTTGDGTTGDGTTGDGTTGDGTTGDGTTGDGTTGDGTTGDGTTGDGTTGDGTTGDGTTGDGSTGGTEGSAATTVNEDPVEPIRVATATKIKIIPNQVSHIQEDVVVIGESDGTLEVLDEDGNVDTFDVTGDGGVQVPDEDPPADDTTGDGTTGDGTTGDGTTGDGTTGDGTTGDGTTGDGTTGDGTSGDGTTGDGTTGDGTTTSELSVEQEVLEEGSDAVVLLQCNSDHSKPEVRSALKAERVTERLARFEAKLVELDAAKAERIATNLLKQQERQEARLLRTSNNSPESSRGKADKALGKARGEDQGSSGNGNSGGGNSGNGNSGGGNSGGGNSDNGGGSGSSGGGGGNSGGGNSGGGGGNSGGGGGGNPNR